ncbi:MAG: hypothetical protein OHK0013_09050 [Sandaracinaceae bacterium]
MVDSPPSTLAAPSTTARARPPRIGVVDAVRGLACVAMIAWHAADCWIGPPARDGWGFERVRLVGGFAAPFFLWLAGLSLALSTELRPSWERTVTGLVRACWVVAVGYALKLFAWTVDHGAVTDPRNLLTLGLAIPAAGALLFALREPALGSAPTRRGAFVIGAGVLFATYAFVGGASHGPDVLTRLDVLHGIGAALAVLGLLLFVLGRVLPSEDARAVVLALLAITIALTTPRWIGVDLPLPSRLVDWIARVVPDPAASGARFPLFPWLGHALYGATIGTLLRASPRELGPHDIPFVKRPFELVLATLVVACLVFEGGWVGPAITARAEWMRPVLRLTFYGTTAMGCAGVLAYAGRLVPSAYEALVVMGRSSLFVYGAHLELVYGLVGSPFRRSLGWTGWAVGALLVTLLMVWGARRLEAWERREERRRARPLPAG